MRPAGQPLGYRPVNRSIVSMLLGTFVLRVSTAITAVLLIFLIDELTRNRGTGPGTVSLLTGGFYTTELTGAIVFGVLADRYGRKVIMLLGPVFGAMAVFLTGLTTHVPTLFVTRLLEGSSTAASIPSTLGFIAAETEADERLRGRVVSLFEFASLGGMLAVGPALGGLLWDAFGRTAFFLDCGLYLVALTMYAYGVSEVRRVRPAMVAAPARVSRLAGSASRYWSIATSRKVLLFVPTWLSINAILGIWANQAPLLLKGNIHDPSQFLMRGVSATTIGIGEAVLAVIFGSGLLFWGMVYARFRRTTLMLMGVAAFVVMTFDVLAINHLGDVYLPLLACLVAVAAAALFALSGVTPAALGLLADVTEGYEADRSAIMGLYSVFLGLGQVVGALVGGIAATWRGIDGLVVATLALLAIGVGALLNLRVHETALVDGDAQNSSVLKRGLLDTVSATAGLGSRPTEAAAKEDR